MSCTLPPAVPKELTPCLVRLYHHTTNTHLHGQLAKNKSRGCALMCLFSPESLGNNNVETFTATLASMSKSKSSPHVGCLSMNRRSLKLRYIHAYAQQKTKKNELYVDLLAFLHNRNNSQISTGQRSPQMIEITINGELLNWFKRSICKIWPSFKHFQQNGRKQC